MASASAPSLIVAYSSTRSPVAGLVTAYSLTFILPFDRPGPTPSGISLGARLLTVRSGRTRRMRILVVGTGDVGSAFATIAQRRSFFDCITLADLDVSRPQSVVDRLRRA